MLAWFADDAKIVLMDQDYTTDSFNLGERTYEACKAYQVCISILNEIVASGCGKQVVKENFRTREGFAFPEEGVPVRPLVAVIPNVTKPLSSNGHDTFHLRAGESISLPSNLAQHLLVNGQASVVEQ